MPRLIVSTVGTATLTNNRSDDARKLLVRHSNDKKPLDGPDRSGLDSLLKDSHERLAAADIEMARKLSAELNGILAYYGGKLHAEHAQDMHYLLSTDTWLGCEAAQMVQEWLRAHGARNVLIRKQDGLQTAEYHAFQAALAELVVWCSEEVRKYHEKGYHVVFNLTGGFKSVQGFMQAIAPFYADEVVYVFESAQDLMRIPRLPIRLDAVAVLEEHLDIFRRLARDQAVSATEAQGIRETLVLTNKGKPRMSPWGQVIWDQHHKEIYEKKLLPPMFDLLRFTKRFEEDVAKLPPDRRATINERIDDLVRYLSSGGTQNLSRLDIKRIKHNPPPPSTHEFDAWGGAGTRRVFAHYEGKVLVLDSLGERLR